MVTRAPGWRSSEMAQDPGGQHGIADSRRRDEEDPHATPGAYRGSGSALPSLAGRSYLSTQWRTFLRHSSTIAARSRSRARTASRSCKGWSRTTWRRPGPRAPLHAALLTAQGRYLHDFFIVAVGDGARARRRSGAARRSAASAVALPAALQGDARAPQATASILLPLRARALRARCGLPDDAGRGAAPSAGGSPISTRGWQRSARGCCCRRAARPPALEALGFAHAAARGL